MRVVRYFCLIFLGSFFNPIVASSTPVNPQAAFSIGSSTDCGLISLGNSHILPIKPTIAQAVELHALLGSVNQII